MKKILLSVFAFIISLNVFSQNDEDRWVDSVFNSLTLEQQVGQLMNLRANQPNKDFDSKNVETVYYAKSCPGAAARGQLKWGYGKAPRLRPRSR